MAFSSGSVSFRRFAVIGSGPSAPDQSLLDSLAQHAIRPGEAVGGEEVEYGWCGGRHVLDDRFDFEHNVFADTLHFALRIDTNRVPSELKKAWQLVEEDAVAASNPSGFISKSQKRQAKQNVGRRVGDELRSGRFRRSKLIGVLWDLPRNVVYCPAANATYEKLAEIFQRSFGLTLLPLSAGALALRVLEPKGRRRDYEDLRPTRFVHGSRGENEHPEYPWTAKGPEPKDFVGNEFLMWLWHETERRAETIATESAGEMTIYIDRALDLECAYGQSGRDSLRGDAPARMPEARDGLRSGKLPRRSGLVLDASRQQFTLNLAAEPLAVSSAKLPDVEDADTPRVLFEERIALLRDLGRALDAMFAAFMKIRASSAWEGQVSAIREWILAPQKKVAAA